MRENDEMNPKGSEEILEIYSKIMDVVKEYDPICSAFSLVMALGSNIKIYSDGRELTQDFLVKLLSHKLEEFVKEVDLQKLWGMPIH